MRPIGPGPRAAGRGLRPAVQKARDEHQPPEKEKQRIVFLHDPCTGDEVVERIVVEWIGIDPPLVDDTVFCKSTCR